MENVLNDLSNLICDDHNFSEGMSLYFYTDGPENTGIALDGDYVWSIIQDGSRTILVCKDA